MADETTQYILGDAAVDALGQPRRRRFFGRRKKTDQPLTHCENCGAKLTGEYCSACGQHAIDYRRSLWRVAVDAADSFLNWDTKFLTSVGVLLTRPAKLTNDFNAGRRVRYVHPLRLYLLASIAFFLLAKLLNFTPSAPPDLSAEDRAELTAELSKLTGPDSPLSPEQRATIDAARARFLTPEANENPEEREKFEKAMLKLPRFAAKKELKPNDLEKLNATLGRIDATLPQSSPAPPTVEAAPHGPPALTTPAATVPPKNRSPFHFTEDDNAATNSPFEKWMETRVKEKLGADGTNAQLFLETLRSNVPTMMLCCVPLFAFVLKVLYIRQGRYYVEHLVYALHIHTFAYVAVVVITLLGLAAARVLPSARGLLVGLLSFAAVIQIFLSIRRVYGQGWFFTTLKFYLGFVSYFVILVCAVIATAFVTLLLP